MRMIILRRVLNTAVRVLIGQMERLREGSEGPLDLGADLKVSRVVLRLLRRVEDQPERERIVERVLPDLHDLSAKMELVRLVGYEPHGEHKVIAEADANRLAEQVRREVLDATPEKLAGERDLFALLAWVTGTGTGNNNARERIREVVANDQVFLRLLRSSLSDAHVQTLGDVAVRTELRLPWDWLSETLGEELVRRRVDEVAKSVQRPSWEKRTTASVELAQRYAGGWRPEEP